MTKRTPSLILSATAGAAIAAAALLAAPAPASAAEARTNAPITVFNGPGYDFEALGNIGAGQNVTVEQCEADFCYLDFGPLSGWAERASLDMKVGAAGGIVVGPDVSIGIGIGEPPPPPPPPAAFPRRPHRGAPPDVCFYDRFDYRGDSFCMSAGESQAFLGDWANSIRSIDNPAGYDVRVCIEPGFHRCRVYTTSARSLGRYDRRISSASVD